MPEKDPTTWGLATWCLISTISFLGGITSWYQRVKSGHTRAFNVIEFIGELVTSFFMGFIGFFAASYFLESHAAAAGVAGMSAHFSTRLLFQAEGLLTAYATAWANRVKAGK